MDAHRVAERINAILQLASSVSEELRRPHDQSNSSIQCAIEITGLSKLLAILESRLHEERPNVAWLAEVQALAAFNGPFDQYKSALEQLQLHLALSYYTGLVATESGEFFYIQSTMERLKSLVQIALEMDHLTLAQARQNGTSVSLESYRDNVHGDIGTRRVRSKATRKSFEPNNKVTKRTEDSGSGIAAPAIIMSKDSGYTNIGSNQPFRGGFNDLDTKNIASPEGYATMVSPLNPTDVGGAAEQLAEFLWNRAEIQRCVKLGFVLMDSDQFEGNFLRLIKNFASELRAEANTTTLRGAHFDKEKEYAIFMIRNATAFDDIEEHIATKLTQERFLEQQRSARPPNQLDTRLEDKQDSNGHEGNEQKSNRTIHSDAPATKSAANAWLSRRRTKTGCLTCRRRRIKCGEERPTCDNCIRVKRQCEGYNQRVIFKDPLNTYRGPTFSTATQLEFVARPARQQGSLDARGQPAQSNVPPGASQHNNTAQSGGSSHSAPTRQNLPYEVRYSSKLDKLKDILISSTAFKDFRAQLEIFVESHPRLPQIMEDLPSQSHIGKLDEHVLTEHLKSPRFLRQAKNILQKSFRPAVPPGSKRVEWICECGDLLYMDFDSNSGRSYQTINALLCSPSATLQSSESSHAPSGILPKPISPPQKVLSKGIFLTNPTTQPGSSSNSPGPLTETGFTSTTKSTQSGHSFFELCVNSGKFLKSLGEISVSSTNAHGVNSIDTDGEFFRKVKDNYLQLRSFRARFWLLKPVNVSYVRFSVEDCYRVGILHKPVALPPKTEVDAKNYHYDPCPLENELPISSDLFLHYVFSCSSPSSRRIWLRRIPRKLDLSIFASTTVAFGWGVHIDEGPDYLKVFVLNLVILGVSGVTALLWDIYRHDFQGAMGFAAWIIMLFNTLMAIFIAKWSQE